MSDQAMGSDGHEVEWVGFDGWHRVRPLPLPISRVARAFRALGREIRRLQLPQPPAWLEGADFTFPDWAPRARPFDWAHDLEDVPPPMPWPERARSWAYLRAPAATVQR